jgi:hypothetical protein
MDIDLVALRAECEALLDRLEGQVHLLDLRRIHMDIAPMIGQLQGMVGARRREVGDLDAVLQAEDALGRLKADSRQVGADIRLASETALAMGLRTALSDALQVIAALERSLT